MLYYNASECWIVCGTVSLKWTKPYVFTFLVFKNIWVYLSQVNTILQDTVGELTVNCIFHHLVTNAFEFAIVRDWSKERA